uniref:MS124, putative transcriptional activator n=1 Tax=Microscilla sp. PRE1 TaxID=155537 RepID=Q93PA7_9BACT|nr:AraC family transcriptional regulator [Microscilla sp. PRE1]AAK62846.1 MS124, putative transcriptional activator [Microscilla sp. PRE1]
MKPVLEKVNLKELETVHAFIYSKPTFESPWHFHPEYELTLILKGSGIRYVGDDISDFKEGDLVMLGSNLPHCWKNDQEHTGESKSLVIQWPEKTIGDLPLFNGIKTLMTKSQRGLRLGAEILNRTSNLMYKVLESSGIQRYLRLIELLDHLAEQAEHNFITGASYSYDLSSSTTNRLDTVQTFVKNRYKGKIRLSDVADELNMSEQAFSRFFSKTMNKPFFLFLNEYRVNIASRMILETDLQMAEIAYKCGYDSLPFFYKQFKKLKGYTPLDFRKMYTHTTKH